MVNSCSNTGAFATEQEEEQTADLQNIQLSEEQMKAVDIKLGKVQKKMLSSVVRANGVLTLPAQNMAEVNSLVSGIVRSITVTEGDFVRQGQVVAQLENTEILSLQKDYIIAQKEAMVAQQEYQRQKTLSEQKAGVEKTLQQASAEYEVAHARQMGLQIQLRQLGINPTAVAGGNFVTQVAVKAPISGIVTKINVKKGSFVDAQNPLLAIADNSAVYCTLSVFERNIAQIRVGQDVDLMLTNASGTELKGKVSKITPSIDDASKAIPVQVKIMGERPSQLMPGMAVTGVVSLGENSVTALSDDAIVRIEGKSYVYVVEKKYKTKDGQQMYILGSVEVNTGTSQQGYTQVDFASGIDIERAEVVTANAFYIASMTADHEED